MKQIFDWLREQIAGEINVPTLIRKDYDFDDGLIHARDLINEAEAKWEAEEKEKPFTVGIDVHKQVMWERDIAIEQLHELGYELGEKPREAECCEWSPMKYLEFSLSDCLTSCGHAEHYSTGIDKYCRHCGKPIKIVEVE